MTQNMQTLMDRAQKVINNSSIFADIYDVTDTKIKVEITWGDWKHDHLYLDYLMREEGFEKIDEYTTEEDGSDTYSAVHVYTLV